MRRSGIWMTMWTTVLILASASCQRAGPAPTAHPDPATAPATMVPPAMAGTIANVQRFPDATAMPQPFPMPHAERGTPPATGIAAMEPGEDVLPAQDTPPDAQGRVLRQRVVRRPGKYPLIAVVESLAQAPGGVWTASPRRSWVADHLVVKLAPGVGADGLRALAARHDYAVRAQIGHSTRYLVSFPVRRHEDMTTARQVLAASTDVISCCETDQIIQTQALPGDEDFGQQWALRNTGQTGGTPGADIHAPAAWDITTGTRAVRIAIIDTGIDLRHPDLAANIWHNPGEVDGNRLDDDGNGYADDITGWDFIHGTSKPNDDNFHGTHVAGIIGAVGDNGLGVSGTCWRVSLVPLKTFDQDGNGFLSDAVVAMEYATALGVDVVSMSWGGMEYSQALKECIDAAGARGILVVAAAGNYGADNDFFPFYPACYACTNLLAVAASDATDQLAGYSNRGQLTVALAAPGSGILSTLPMIQTAAMLDRGLPIGYGTLSGTSMATPFVSGAAALIRSAAPELTMAQLRQLLLDQTDALPAFDHACIAGGRLDLARCVAAATGQVRLTVESTVVVDDGSAGTAGNGDGLAGPGETVGLQIAVRNRGTAATVVHGSLISNDAALEVLTPGGFAFGNIPSQGTGHTGAPLRVRIAVGVHTPAMVRLILRLVPEGAPTVDLAIELTIVTGNLIAGQVLDITGDLPLAGAEVAITGAGGNRTWTGADGRFSLAVGDGAHALTASLAGYTAGDAVTVTTPPGATDLVLHLGRAVMRVQGAPLTTVTPAGGTSTEHFSVANDGDMPLHLECDSLQAWLTVAPTRATVLPGTSQAFAVTASATDQVAASNANGTVLVHGDDPVTPSISVTVGQTVTAVPRLVLTRASVTDVQAPYLPYIGNGDYLAEPGETVGLVLMLQNQGQAVAQAVTGTVHCDDAQVEFLATDSSYGDITAGSYVFPQTFPLLRIAPGCPSNHAVAMTIDLVDAAGHAVSIPFSILVDRYATLRGRVTDAATGAPVAWPLIDIDGALAPSMGDDRANGNFEINGLRPGNHRIRAWVADQAYEPVEAPVDFAPDAVQRHDFILHRKMDRHIAVSHPAVTLTLEQGATGSVPFVISNTGTAPVSWWAGITSGELDYVASDSDHAVDVAFSWDDLANYPRVMWPHGGGMWMTGSMPFQIPMYERMVQNMLFPRFGCIIMDANTGWGPVNTALPSSAASAGMLAWCWGDLQYGSAFGMMPLDEGSFVMQWNEARFRRDPSIAVTCQIRFDCDGTITFNYLHATGAHDCTVGMQNLNCDRGTTVTWNQGYLHDGLAVRLTPTLSWLPGFTPSRGRLAGGTDRNLPLTFSAAGLALGDHQATLRLTSNDPHAPLQSVPITLTVVAPAGGPASPTAVADAWTLLEDQVLEVAAPGILGNDSANDAGTLTAECVTPPLMGTLALQTDGSFRYTPFRDAAGLDSFTYRARRGAAVSSPVTVAIAITPVNDAPAFRIGADVAVDQGGQAHVMHGWATAIAAGGPDESQQRLTFTCRDYRSELFATPPSITADGTLSFTAAAGASGATQVSVVLEDDGDVYNQGGNRSAIQTFSITIAPVYQPPAFTAGGDVAVPAGSGAQILPSWATGIRPASTDPAGSALIFVCTVEHAELFSVLPAMTGDGTLTFTPAPGAGGSSRIGIRLLDPPGDGSDTVVRTITILPLPVITSAATASASYGTAFSYQITASNSPVTFGATGLPVGLTVNASTGVVSGTFPVSGPATFTVTATNVGGTGSQEVTVTVAKGDAVVVIDPASLTATADGTAKPITVATIPPGLGVAVTYTVDGMATDIAPAAIGHYPVAVNVTDVNYQGTAVGTLNITVSGSDLTNRSGGGDGGGCGMGGGFAALLSMVLLLVTRLRHRWDGQGRRP